MRLFKTKAEVILINYVWFLFAIGTSLSESTVPRLLVIAERHRCSKLKADALSYLTLNPAQVVNRGSAIRIGMFTWGSRLELDEVKFMRGRIKLWARDTQAWAGARENELFLELHWENLQWWSVIINYYTFLSDPWNSWMENHRRKSPFTHRRCAPSYVFAMTMFELYFDSL